MRVSITTQGLRVPRDRVASIAVVVALHVAMVAMLLEMSAVVRERREEPETFVPLERILEMKPRAERRARSPMPSGSRAITVAPVLPPALAEPNLPAIGDVLFRCVPEKLEMLSEEQRKRCRLALGGPPGDGWTAFKPAPAESQYAELWQKAIKDRETPVRIPCAGVSGSSLAMKTPDGRPMGGPPVKVKPGFGVSYTCLALRLWQILNR